MLKQGMNRCNSWILQFSFAPKQLQSRFTALRLKSEKSEQDSSVIVEKEKKEKDYRGRAINWQNLPEKSEELNEYLVEMIKPANKRRNIKRMNMNNEILYYFRNKKDLEHWFIHTDEGIGGRSWGEFVQSENGMTAAFRGYTSQRLPRHMLPSGHDKLAPKQIFTGYACVQTKPFKSLFNREDRTNIFGFNNFEIRLRGDGRRYMFETVADFDQRDMTYSAPIHTNGGPEWQTVVIPYSKMISTYKSRYTLAQNTMMIDLLRSFRFLLMDGIQGPFQLEIDYIALKKDFSESTGKTDYWDPYTDTNTMLGTW